MSRRTKIADQAIRRPAVARKTGAVIRMFRPADACLHHQAASLMTRRDRQAWAREANKALRCGKTVEQAIKDANFTLNAFLDYDADRYLGASAEYITATNVEAVRAKNRAIISNDPIRAATSRRFKDRDYYSAELDFDRHPQLLAALERQRRVAGPSH